MRKNKAMKWLAVISSVALLLAGCGSSGGSSSSGDSGETTFNVGLTAEPPKLDPAFNYDNGTFYTLPNICDTLLKYDENSELQPNLASSWTMSDDGLTYVYQIRDDVKFSDGTQMTADDVVYCLNRIIDPNTGSSIAWLMESVDSVEKTGDWEVTVKLKKPDASWQYMPATACGQIYSKAACEAAGSAFGSADGLPVGTGAYKVDSWSSGTELKLSINEYYWKGTDDIDVKKLNYKFFTDQNAQLVALQSGQIDFIISVPLEQISQIESTNKYNIIPVSPYSFAGLWFDTKKEYLCDPWIRKAIAYVMDEEAYTKAVYGEYATVEMGYTFSPDVTVDSSLWNSYADSFENKYNYNLEKAKECMAQSSYPDGGFTLKAVANKGDNAYTKMAQMLQQACKEINIDIDIEEVTGTEFATYAFGGDYDSNGVRQAYDILCFGWGPDYPDPMGCLQPLFHSSMDVAGGSNMAQYDNPEVDALIDEQSKYASDFTKRSELMNQAFTLIQQDCAYKALCHPDRIYAISKKFTYKPNRVLLWSFFVSDVKLAE